MTAKKAETAAAETETVAAEAAPEVQSSETVSGEASMPTVARRSIMLKQLLPNADWINQNIVAGGKGTKAVIGRIYGIATGTERKAGTLPDGTPSETINVKGMFQAESYLTGELTEATSVYFPMAYAEQLEHLFKDGEVKSAEVDIDAGLEATGKTIPYAWVVVSHREGKQMDALKRLRSTRQRPANILTAPDGSPKALPSA